jgi:peptidoglycan/xylan/chitin deacetylase (PgdA/CDA1 family)
MKKVFPILTAGFVLIGGMLSSCASRPSVVVPEMGEIPETREAPEIGEVPERSFMDWITAKVKAGDPDLKKYFLSDPDSGPGGGADFEGEEGCFMVRYDLRNARPLDASRFRVGFSVENKSTGEIREDELIWIVREDHGGILLSMDDNYEDAWEGSFDLFDRYGARLTFFVLGDVSPFCRKALERGHDIGYHSVHHLNLLKVSREAFFEETLEGAEGFKKEGIPLAAFAYPYGFWEDWMHRELSGTYRMVRGFGVRFHLYDEESLREGYVASASIDNIVYKSDREFEDTVTLMLRTAKFIGGILPLTSHTIADDAPWGITRRRLEYLLQNAAALKLRFYRYSDL